MARDRRFGMCLGAAHEVVSSANRPDSAMVSSTAILPWPRPLQLLLQSRPSNGMQSGDWQAANLRLRTQVPSADQPRGALSLSQAAQARTFDCQDQARLTQVGP